MYEKNKRSNRAVKRNGEIINRRTTDDENVKFTLEIEGKPTDIQKIFSNVVHQSPPPDCHLCGRDVSKIGHSEQCEFNNRIEHNSLSTTFVEDEDRSVGKWGDFRAELVEPSPEKLNVVLRKNDGTIVAKLQAWEEEDEYGESSIRVNMDGDTLSRDEFLKVYAPIMRDYYEHENSAYRKNPSVEDIEDKVVPLPKENAIPNTNPQPNSMKEEKPIFDFFNFDKKDKKDKKNRDDKKGLFGL